MEEERGFDVVFRVIAIATLMGHDLPALGPRVGPVVVSANGSPSCLRTAFGTVLPGQTSSAPMTFWEAR